MNKIIFITGGARSGKSSFALEEGSRMEGPWAYIATAQALDEEMKERIERHKRERPAKWDTYEEPLNVPALIGELQERYKVILIDCLTIWLSNLFCVRLRGIARQGDRAIDKLWKNLFIKKGLLGGPVGQSYQEEEIERFLLLLKNYKYPSAISMNPSALFIVSNEVGLGIVPENDLARKFRDLAGKINQEVAQLSDEVYFIISGIPVRIKG